MSRYFLAAARGLACMAVLAAPAHAADADTGTKTDEWDVGEPPSGAVRETAPSPSLARTSAFLEVGGSAILYSLNADVRVIKPFAIRAGFEAVPVAGLSGGSAFVVLVVPVTASLLLGGDHHLFEIGGGTVLVPGGVPPVWYTGIVGYRYQPVRGGMLFRAGFTPVYRGSIERLLPLPGISIGRTF